MPLIGQSISVGASSLGGGGLPAYDEPTFASVGFLLDFNAVSGNDESNNGWVMDYNSTVANSSQNLFGQETVHFNGSNVTFPNGDAFKWHDGFDDIVLETWIYPTAFDGDMVANYQASFNQRYWLFRVDGAGLPRMSLYPTKTTSVGAITVFGPVMTLDTWNYVAFMRNDDDHYVFTGLEGGDALPGTVLNSTVRPETSGGGTVSFGNRASLGGQLAGRISETRLVHGLVGGYLPVDGFKVPTGPFPRS